ncbi:antibiotic biosynthesis monooxygenase family protein [Sinomicrobium weinanense]|uniref:Antibiotic biosynthesis monooxygenase n=1 Tax=Sinomicrobium weinanense TaxID=2842200 RepID=A0A926Q113_9FLAO|nr:antibiotic biosynthesis monooxygenase family protein [Sinomicrobium weinanense]MBC9795397.1 antibiotic biosynthesis monooxygenase [Sinomicrobium weinanense]MBU3122888.1 antibiotic biosynthesis monooxygenase [Sinomicrobium weinanense]
MKPKIVMQSVYVIAAMLFFLSQKGFSQLKSENMNTNHSLEVIRYTIPKSQHKNFEQAYSEAGKHLQSSAYCLGYNIVHGDEDPDNYIVFIQWTSADEHLNGFRKSPEFTPFLNLVRPFYNNIQEMKHYNPTTIQWTKE